MSANKCLGIILGLSPILNVYSSGIRPFSIAQFLLLLVGLWCMSSHKKRIHFYFVPFIIYSILVSILGLTQIENTGAYFHDILALALSFFYLFLIVDYADRGLFIKYFSILAKISIVFLYFQYLLSLIGIRISGIIPFLPLAGEAENQWLIDYQTNYTERLCSIFSEPAHFANVAVVFVMLTLYNEGEQKKKLFWAIIASAAVLICQSAGGYVILAVVWLLWIYHHYMVEREKGFKAVFVVLTILCLGVMLMGGNEKFAGVMGRYSEISVDADVSSHSSQIRVIRGFIPFFESGLLYQIFGHGVGSFEEYMIHHPGSKFFFISEFTTRWINSLQYLLFCTGIIGTFLYFAQLIKFMLKTSHIGVVAGFLVIASFTFEDSLCSLHTTILFFILITRLNPLPIMLNRF